MYSDAIILLSNLVMQYRIMSLIYLKLCVTVKKCIKLISEITASKLTQVKLNYLTYEKLFNCIDDFW